ncbi:MAG: hypothetical protein IAE84_19840 [Saprospiraceae bacterium]|nr:hypothetical protein [Saprospiraceae bacterium]
MNKRTLYTTTAVVTAILLWLANAAGPGNVQGIDRTGSPLSPGACDACHSGGNFAPTVTAELLDAGTPVTQYQPNKSYTLRVRVTAASGTPTRYGFQAVALTGSANTSAGVFGANPTGFRKTTISNRTYVEHSTPRTANTMDFPWTSPATPGEEIRFYAAGIAANNNSNSSGDAGAQLSAPLVLTPLVSSSNDIASEKFGLKILGNPIGDQLRIRMQASVSGEYRFALISLNGSTLWNREIYLAQGDHPLNFDASALPDGVYILQVSNGVNTTGIKLIK